MINRQGLRAVVLAVAALTIYATRLGVSPIYLTHDEVIYARNAYSIATTGRDLNGQFLPISIPVTGTFYATPANIYLTAAFLKVLPLSETTIRLPSVVVGLLCVCLVGLIARRMLGTTYGLLAALILLLTPAHFIHSRLGTDHLYVVACVLAWWALLAREGKQIQAGRMFVASAFLGLSLYTYLGATITAPACVAITWVWLAMAGRKDPQIYVAAIGGFVFLAIPFVVWHLTHPGQYAQQIRMYALYDSQTLDAAQGARALVAPTSIAERGAVYWDYFNPSFLFFAGDTGLLNGTRYTGVFLLPMLILIPVGILTALIAGGSRRRLLVMLLVASPLAAVVVAERYRINRALIMLPVAAILATVAIEDLWRRRGRVGRWVAIVLVAGLPLQFGGFYRDYFGDYRVRSYPWFEYNLRGGMAEIIHRADDADQIWISDRLQWADYYWPFYLDMSGRRELASRTHYLDPSQARLSDIGPGYVLCRASEEQRFLDAGFTRVTAVLEPDQTHSLTVLRR
ncbi:MAG: glycosyltransferase family 39 protein [Vicinamibacterales bacterium]